MLRKIEGRRRRGRQRMMVGWHHQLNRHDFEQAPGTGDGQGSLACCSSWSRKESDTTERLNWTEYIWSSQVALVVRNSPANAGNKTDSGFNPALGRSPGEGNGNPLQHSCLGNPMDRGAWWATDHGVPKSQRQLSTRAIQFWVKIQENVTLSSGSWYCASRILPWLEKKNLEKGIWKKKPLTSKVKCKQLKHLYRTAMIK